MFLWLSACALTTIADKKASFPDSHGTLDVAGLDDVVSIHRDAAGVPHIRAETDHDLWFSLGFVHAQDRLFQMDLMRRIGGGRVSAWLGPDYVAFDTFMRGLEIIDERALVHMLPCGVEFLLQVVVFGKPPGVTRIQ